MRMQQEIHTSFHCPEIFFKQQGCILHGDHELLREERNALKSSLVFKEKTLACFRIKSSSPRRRHEMWYIQYYSDVIFNPVLRNLMVYKGIWLQMKGQQPKKIEKAYFAALSFCSLTGHGAQLSWHRASNIRKDDSCTAAFIVSKNTSRCY